LQHALFSLISASLLLLLLLLLMMMQDAAPTPWDDGLIAATAKTWGRRRHRRLSSQYFCEPIAAYWSLFQPSCKLHFVHSD